MEKNEEQIESKYRKLGNRLNLRRQTKLICPLDNKQNDYSYIEKMVQYGIDAFEIKSNVEYKIANEIINKIHYISANNVQILPIIYHLSYYSIYVSQINNGEESIRLNKGDIVIITDKNNYKNFMNTDSKELFKDNFDLNENLNESNDTNLIDMYERFIKIENIKKESINNRESKSNKKVLCTYPQLNYSEFKEKMTLLIRNNRISIEVTKICDNHLTCKVIGDGEIFEKSLISTLTSEFEINENNLTKKNSYDLISQIQMAVDLKVDFVIISVSDNPVEEITKIRKLLNHISGEYVKIIVSINNQVSLSKLDYYIDIVDAIIFDRNELVLKVKFSTINNDLSTVVSKCSNNCKLNFKQLFL